MKKDTTEKVIDWDMLDAVLPFKPTIYYCAELFDCHPDTLQNHIKKTFNMTFKEYRDRKMDKIRLQLQQKAINKALEGRGDNVMLIFCLKNLCGWSDKPEVPGDDEEEAYPEV